jgi:HSP20 family protein
MQKEINRMFDTFWRGGTLADRSFYDGEFSPAVDIAEEDDQYLVKVELPGVSKDDVKITMEGNLLTISGEKKGQKETKKNYHALERSYGSFSRSFTLPTTVQGDKVAAEYKDGVLTINLPKAEEAKRKQIEVKVK